MSNSGGNERPGGHGTDLIPADKALLVFIYDLLRRRGMDRTAELLAQEAELTTEQLGQCMQFVTQAIGTNPSKVGFLTQFWMMLWDMLAAKGNSQASGGGGAGSVGLSGILSQMMIGSPSVGTAGPPSGNKPPVGMTGRDPTNMTPAEMQAFAAAVSSTSGKAPTSPMPQVPVQAAPSHPPQQQPHHHHPQQQQTFNTQQMQQQIMQYQAMLMHQQQQHQILVQQFQQMLFQQQQQQQQMSKAGGKGQGVQSQVLMPPQQPQVMLSPQQQQQQLQGIISPQPSQVIMPQQQQSQGLMPQPQYPPQQPIQQQQQHHPTIKPSLPRPLTTEAEDAMLSYLQGTPAQQQPQMQYGYLQPQAAKKPQQTAMESTAHKSILQKRQRTNSTESLGSNDAAELDTDQFLNMPDIDEKEQPPSTINAENLLTPSGRKTICEDLQRLESFSGVHSERVVSVHISADSRLAVSAGRDRKIVIYDVQSRSLLGILPMIHKERVSRARFAQTGKKRYLLTGAFDKTVQLWDLGDFGSPLERLPEVPVAIYNDEYSGLVISVETSTKIDDETGSIDVIASCDTDGTLVIRSIKEHRVLHTRPDPNKSTVRMITFQPDGDTLIALAVDDRVEVYDWRAGKVVYTIKAPNGRPVVSTAWDRGLILVTTDTDSYAWSLDFCLPLPSSESYTGRMVAKFTAPGDKIHGCAFLRNGTVPLKDYMKPRQTRLIVVGGWKKVFLWRINYERQAGRKVDERGLVRPFEAHSDLVSCLTSGGQLESAPFVVSGSFDNSVILWRLQVPQSEATGTNPADLSEGDVSGTTEPASGGLFGGASSVDELAPPIDFDPLTMFLDTDGL